MPSAPDLTPLMTDEVRAHSTGNGDYRLRDMERRIDRIERIVDQVPLDTREIAALKEDIAEVRETAKSMTRALYTGAISVTGSAVLFLYGVTELFK